MDIPYIVELRRDTGLYNAKLGIWLFLASEVMLFGALFSGYILLRVGADPGTWPRGLLNIPIGTFNTAVLITSSVTVVLSWAALKMNNFARFKKVQAITLLCALGFLSIKSYEYSAKFKHYEVWLTDGRRMTGHIEGNPWFWNTRTLKDKKLERIVFHPDAHHYADPHRPKPGQEGGSEHSAHGPKVEIETSNVKRLAAFVPAHRYLFCAVFHTDGPARVARVGWRLGDWLPVGAGVEDVADRSGTLHQSRGGVRTLLALCGPDLDFSVSGVISSLIRKIMADTHPHDLSRQVKIYICVFIGLLVGTILTVAMYYVHFASMAVTVTIALFIATVKGFLVAGFFMHLISERKAIYTILIAAVIFFTALMYLTVLSRQQVPHGTAYYGTQPPSRAATNLPAH